MRAGLIVACTIGLAAVSLPPSHLEAQVATQLQEGIRVRVVPNNGKAAVGIIAARTADTLSIIRGKAGAPPQGFAFSEISRVDVSRGKSRAKGALVKGAIGLGLGALAGGVIGAATYSEGDGCQPGPNNWCLFDCFIVCSRSEAGLLVGTLGGATGLLVGTAVGIATGWEQWESVPARTR